MMFDSFPENQKLKAVLNDFLRYLQASPLDSKSFIAKYDKNRNGYLDQQEFINILKNMNSTSDEIVSTQLFQYLNQKYGKINETCIAQLKNIKTTNPQNLFLLMNKILDHKGISVKDYFRQFDTNNDNKLDQKQLWILFKCLLKDMNDSEFQMILQVLGKKQEYTLFEIMKALQQENSMINSQKLENKQRPQTSNQQQQVSIQQENNPNQSTQQLLVDFLIFRENSGLRTNDFIQKYDANKNGYLDQQEFISICQQIKPNSEKIASYLYYQLQQKHRKVDELCINYLTQKYVNFDC